MAWRHNSAPVAPSNLTTVKSANVGGGLFVMPAAATLPAPSIATALALPFGMACTHNSAPLAPSNLTTVKSAPDLVEPAATTLPAPSIATALPPPTPFPAPLVTCCRNTSTLLTSTYITAVTFRASTLVVKPAATTFPVPSIAVARNAPPPAVPETLVCQAQASAHKKTRPQAPAEPVSLSIRAHIPFHRLQRAESISFSSMGEVGG